MVNLLKIPAMPALLLVAACATQGTDTVTRLKTEPVLTGGTYSTGGGITVASAFRDIDGQIAVCGLWSESAVQTPYSKGKAQKVLSSGAAYLNGVRLVSGLESFRKIPATTDYSQTSAPCAVSDKPWQSEYANRAPDIRLPQQIVYQDRGGVKGPIVEFRQTGPGALGGSLNLVQAVFGNTVRVPLGQAPVLGGGRYSSGGGVKAAVELRQIGKSTYACGVWSESRGQSPRTEMQAPEVLARGRIVADGKTIIEDLRFLRRVSARKPLAGRQANCVDTGQPWTDVAGAQRVAVHFRSFVVYPGPGRPVTFSPTGP